MCVICLDLQVISWIWQCNDIANEEKRALQDRMIHAMFEWNGQQFSKEYNNEIQVRTWDDNHTGWADCNTMHRLAQRVGLFGPVAGILG